MRTLFVAAAAGVYFLVGPFLALRSEQDPNVVAAGPRTPEEEAKAFRLPPGFHAELVAAEPAIQKPLNMAFDVRGRLWVTDTVEYPFPAPPGRTPRDTLKVLEDFDEHGRARKVTTFADGLNIPIGVLPAGDGALVHSIPNIYRVRDTNGNAKANRRDVLYGSIGYRDTHGMTSGFTWGFDGWIYACHGFANDSTIKAADGSSIRLYSGNTYRMRPDGSRVEQVTHGQVNPFGLCFDSRGDLYSADCHTKPVMLLLRGGWYESFGKPHDGLGFAPEMIDRYDDSTAIAGITYYAADHFPPAFRDQLYIGDVMTHNIVQFGLTWHGSSPKASLKYFLKSDDPWFRPVDIKLGPDGALYVADFYNRIIGHYEVPLTHPGRDRDRGRIWRIVYRGPNGNGRAQAPRADWSKATTTELIEDLAHPNLTVRTFATNQLAERGSDAAQAVRRLFGAESRPTQRAHGLWVLHRVNALDESTLQQAARDLEPLVRIHTQQVLAERRAVTPALAQLARDGLRDADPFVRRAAAAALGRHPSPENIRPLLDLVQAVAGDDTHLRYAVRMALRDQLRTAKGWATARQQSVVHAAADRQAIADVALGVPSADAAQYLFDSVTDVLPKYESLLRAAHHIARYGAHELSNKLLASWGRRLAGDPARLAAVLKEMQQGMQEQGRMPDAAFRAAADELAGRMLAAPDPVAVLAGIDLAVSFRLDARQDALARLATANDRPEPQRRAALAALAGLDGSRHTPLLARVLADAAAPPGVREQAAIALATINQPAAREQLVKGLQSAPARLEIVFAAELARSAEGAEQLLQAVAAGKASARLLQERSVVTRLQAARPNDAKRRIAALTVGLPPADRKAEELLRQRRGTFAAAKTDPAAGAKIFEKSCAICHQLAGKGAKVGPQLDGIGIRGLDRLLEDLLDPNRNVDQAFRATTLLMKNGQVLTGLVLREEGEVIVLADAQGKEVRVPKTNVEERTLSPLSPMPANFAEQVTLEEFNHLLAFLLNQRAPDTKK